MKTDSILINRLSSNCTFMELKYIGKLKPKVQSKF